MKENLKRGTFYYRENGRNEHHGNYVEISNQNVQGHELTESNISFLIDIGLPVLIFYFVLIQDIDGLGALGRNPQKIRFCDFSAIRF